MEANATRSATAGATFPALVRAELDRARGLHAWSGSPLEAWAVVEEEVAEFWEEVRKKREARDPARMLAELVQVGAMAQRAAEECAGIRPGVFEATVAEWIDRARDGGAVAIATAHYAYGLFRLHMGRWLSGIAEGNFSQDLHEQSPLVALGCVARMAAEDLGLLPGSMLGQTVGLDAGPDDANRGTIVRQDATHVVVRLDGSGREVRLAIAELKPTWPMIAPLVRPCEATDQKRRAAENLAMARKEARP